MIRVLVLFTFKEGQKQSKSESIDNLVLFLKSKSQNVEVLAGLQEKNKFAIMFSFEQDEDWSDFEPELDINDDFVEIISSVSRPPKIYAFTVID